MKKVFLLAALAFGMNASAQTAIPTDTAVNAETNNYTVPTNYLNGGDGVYTASIVATKITGTAAAVAYLQGSVDGTNFKNITSPYGNYADSFIVTDVAGAQVKNWYLKGNKMKSMRVQVVTTGTQTTQLKAYFIKN